MKLFEVTVQWAGSQASSRRAFIVLAADTKDATETVKTETQMKPTDRIVNVRELVGRIIQVR